MKPLLHNIFSQGEQRILLFLAFFLLLGIGLKLSGNEQFVAPETPADSLRAALAEDFRLMIDIRSAGKEELMTLSGIGEKRALDIIAFREAQVFVNVNDLLKVPGIGPKTYLKNLDKLVVFGDSLIQETPSSSSKAIATNKDSQVNINTASLEELCALSGIGAVKAKAIIQYREEQGPFHSPEELSKVKGIGPATLQKNLHRIKL